MEFAVRRAKSGGAERLNSELYRPRCWQNNRPAKGACDRPVRCGLRLLTRCPSNGVREVACGKRRLALTRVEYNKNTTRLSGNIVVNLRAMVADVSSRVFIRYSTDSWKSYNEVDAHFLCARHLISDDDGSAPEYETHTCEPYTDQVEVKFYAFSLLLGRSLRSRVEFVIFIEEGGLIVYRDDEHGPPHAAEVVAVSALQKC